MRVYGQSRRKKWILDGFPLENKPAQCTWGAFEKSYPAHWNLQSCCFNPQTQSFGTGILLLSQLPSTGCLCSKALQHEGAVCFCSPPIRAWADIWKKPFYCGLEVSPQTLSASGIILWDKMCHQIIDREWASYSSASTTETACKDLSWGKTLQTRQFPKRPPTLLEDVLSSRPGWTPMGLWCWT